MIDLDNNFARGNNEFPKDLAEAFSMVDAFTNRGTNNPQSRRQPSVATVPPTNPTIAPTTPPTTSVVETHENGMTYAQVGEIVPGIDGTTKPGVPCYKCGRHGHYANYCPSAGPVQMVQMETISNADPEFTFTQMTDDYSNIPSHWVLLDSQSTVSVFKYRGYLSNIRQSPSTLKVKTNGGVQTCTKIGEVKNFGTVWYDPKSLTNILSLAAVRKICRITMDSNIEPSLNVHRTNGTIMKFVEHTNGLYYHDPMEFFSSTIVLPIGCHVTTKDETLGCVTVEICSAKADVDTPTNRNAVGTKLAPTSHQTPTNRDTVGICLVTTKSNNTTDRTTVGTKSASTDHHFPTDCSSIGKQSQSRDTCQNGEKPRKPTVLHMHRVLSLCLIIFTYTTTFSRNFRFRTVVLLNAAPMSTMLLDPAMFVVDLFDDGGFGVTKPMGSSSGFNTVQTSQTVMTDGIDAGQGVPYKYDQVVNSGALSIKVAGQQNDETSKSPKCPTTGANDGASNFSDAALHITLESKVPGAHNTSKSGAQGAHNMNESGAQRAHKKSSVPRSVLIEERVGLSPEK